MDTLFEALFLVGGLILIVTVSLVLFALLRRFLEAWGDVVVHFLVGLGAVWVLIKGVSDGEAGFAAAGILVGIYALKEIIQGWPR